MDFKKYQKLSMRTKNNNLTKEQQIENAAMGLVCESAEVMDLLKKGWFQEHGLNEANIKKELGDIMWYMALMCDTCDFNFSEILSDNVDKLKKRFPERFSAKDSVKRIDMKEEK